MRLASSLLAALVLAACDPSAMGPGARYADEASASAGLQRLTGQSGARELRDSAEVQGRFFHVVYDLTAARETDWAEQLRRDWSDATVGPLHLTDSPAYLRDADRPVVVLRGLGSPQSPGTVAQAMDAIDWFKAQGCYVVGEVPSGWRTGEGTRPNFLAAFVRLDAVQPRTLASDAAADRAFAAQLGIAWVQAP